MQPELREHKVEPQPDPEPEHLPGDDQLSGEHASPRAAEAEDAGPQRALLPEQPS